MSDEIHIPDRDLTIPAGSKNEKDPVRQVPFRVHVHDHKLLRLILERDKMSIQKFLAYCLRAYLDADPNMLKLLRTYRELDSIPKEYQEKHVLSQRERLSIFDEIEKDK